MWRQFRKLKVFAAHRDSDVLVFLSLMLVICADSFSPRMKQELRFVILILRKAGIQEFETTRALEDKPENGEYSSSRNY